MSELRAADNPTPCAPAPAGEAWAETNLSAATAALRYGVGPGALRLHDGDLPFVSGAEARWRPLPGGAGLEPVDRQGRSSGWALVRRPRPAVGRTRPRSRG
jgi:hypothetical protein